MGHYGQVKTKKKFLKGRSANYKKHTIRKEIDALVY